MLPAINLFTLYFSLPLVPFVVFAVNIAATWAIMSELSKASGPRWGVWKSDAWKKAPTSQHVIVWWCLRSVGILVSLYLSWAHSPNEIVSQETLLWVLGMRIARSSAVLGSHLFGIFVIAAITSAQEKRFVVLNDYRVTHGG